MQAPDSETLDSAVPLFDVVISMPTGAKLETIQQLATTQAGLSPERVERLIKALRSSPNAKVGSAVTMERAEEEKIRFTKAGLHAEITPLLTVKATTTGSYDGLDACPACGKRSVMPKNRQCPACGVFVDKLTDEYLLRKKVMQQERGALEFQQARSAKNTDKSSRESLEASIRAQVREELYGKEGGLFKRKGGMVLVSVAAIAMGLLYAGEKGVTIGGMALPWGKKETVAPTNMSASSLQQASGSAGAAGVAGAAAAAGDPTGDVDVDDPLIQAAGGKRIGAKGLTMEEAVAAANVLGKSVGNTTADRPLAGAGGKAGAGGSKAEATDAVGTVAVPKQTKQLLTAEFAVVLAEMGQGARAREVLRSLGTTIDPAAEVQAAAAFQAAQLKAQAWSVQRMDGAQARQAAEELKARTQAIANAQERTHLQGAVAVILSRSMQLPSDIPRQFLSLAAESLKAVSGQGQAGLGDLAVSMAEVFLHETTARAKSGAWSKAKASAAQIEDLLKQAPDAWAQSRLYAVDHQAKLQTGQTDKATKSLEAALNLAAKNGNLLERAIWLRHIARLSDAATQEQFDAATASLQAKLGSKSGMEKAQAMTELSLLYTAAGLPAKSSQYRTLAQSTAGLSATDTNAINTDLVVRGDMAMAKMLHGLGRYADAETLLQRVGGYVF